ncbi:hypothetical protein [Ktedonospora formicarum]|uniref:Major facilitator superfamily (MFS) profile domain-containing protein n=1 Tax=Ktedonospora formicarum TaxID=2778364 RepID=A0A8J3IBY3_9CHLR|nr:hypothetical protein [Ktedonospora formicarum]GHO48564.1 hypothetical protein KSX_67270 [Ktedonospora formicarum]
MAGGLALLAVVPSWEVALSAAVIFGCGFGLYVGVDIALAIRVLPKNGSSGKDLGLLYTSIFVPLILSPIIGASVLNVSSNNYAMLFLVAALSSVLAAGLIVPIKSVR